MFSLLLASGSAAETNKEKPANQSRRSAAVQVFDTPELEEQARGTDAGVLHLSWEAAFESLLSRLGRLSTGSRETQWIN